MKPEEIHITDYMRILLGQVPWSFLIEAVIRISFLYLLILVSMRLLGKRMSSQLSRNEMAALVALAAATGVPMLAPDRGLLPPFIIAIVVIIVQRLLYRWGFGSKKFEHITQGDIGIMVEDGCLQFPAMEKAILSRERLFAELRSNGVVNLGNVQRTYMESNGTFTVIQHPHTKPGLSILPEWDNEYNQEQKKANGIFACGSCGHLSREQRRPDKTCGHCGKDEWKEAIES